ncbi:hypothetical protein BGZ60DRAFT_70229 [Tricladium varicosporioides]|nr:hypothetical protein BGZ60DRAFT_70229 [Hymenoscyphus varicosporioides]
MSCPMIMRQMRFPSQLLTHQLSYIPPVINSQQIRRSPLAFVNLGVIANEVIPQATIRNMKILNCVLAHVTIVDSLVQCCLLRNCKVINSQIEYSSVTYSQYEGTYIDRYCVVKDGQMTESPGRLLVSLRRLPPEIRTIIYGQCIDNSIRVGDRKEKKLLKALRCDAQLYPEALRVYYLNCCCTLKNGNILPPNRALKNVSVLMIRCQTFPLIMPVPLLLNMNLRNLTLAPSSWSAQDMLSDLAMFLKNYLNHFAGIKTIRIVLNAYHRDVERRADHTLLAVDYINKALGLRGKLERVATKKADDWCWRATPGQTLKWQEPS